MTIDDVLALLTARHEPIPRPLRLPTEAEVAQAEQELSFLFPPQYRKFVLEASHVTYGLREPGLVLPNLMPYLSLRAMAHDGWSAGIARDHLPFCTDNGNYFTLSREGKIGYFDHNDGSHRVSDAEFKDWILEDWLETEADF